MRVIAEIALLWNGATLMVRVEPRFGWLDLTGEPLPSVFRLAVPMTDHCEWTGAVVDDALGEVGGWFMRNLGKPLDGLFPDQGSGVAVRDAESVPDAGQEDQASHGFEKAERDERSSGHQQHRSQVAVEA